VVFHVVGDVELPVLPIRLTVGVVLADAEDITVSPSTTAWHVDPVHVVNKYQSHKAKAKYKYSSLKAKAKAKHLTLNAKSKAEYFIYVPSKSPSTNVTVSTRPQNLPVYILYAGHASLTER